MHVCLVEKNTDKRLPYSSSYGDFSVKLMNGFLCLTKSQKLAHEGRITQDLTRRQWLISFTNMGHIVTPSNNAQDWTYGAWTI